MNNYDLPRPHISTTLPFSVHSWPRDSVAADSAAEQGVFNAEPAVHFNAFNCETAFRIGVSSDVEYALLPALMHRLRVEAPNATLTTHTLDHQLASDGDITVSIGLSPMVQPGTRHEHLRQVQSVVLRADTRPGPLTLDELCQRPYIGVSGSGALSHYFDDSLRLLDRTRKTVLTVSQLHLIPSMLARTDMLAVVPDYVAGMMVAQGGLRADPVPLPASTLALSMAWQAETDPAQQWLRSRLRMFLREQ